VCLHTASGNGADDQLTVDLVEVHQVSEDALQLNDICERRTLITGPWAAVHTAVTQGGGGASVRLENVGQALANVGMVQILDADASILNDLGPLKS
jgi:hypothetical protein